MIPAFDSSRRSLALTWSPFKRNLESADVGALLWEVKRFRALALHVHQLQRILGTLSGPQGDVLETIRAQLEGNRA